MSLEKNRYTDGAGKLRCMKCDGYAITGKPCKKCLNRKKAERAAAQEVEDAAAREARRRAASAQARAWRTRELRRYTNRVLAKQGAERIAFMERNPISEMFR